VNNINELQQQERDLTLEVATLEEKVASNTKVTRDTIEKLEKKINLAIRTLQPKQPSLPSSTEGVEMENYKSEVEKFAKYSIAFSTYNVFPTLKIRLSDIRVVSDYAQYFKSGEIKAKSQLLADLMRYVEDVYYSNYAADFEPEKIAEIIERYLP
jgi:D-mannonate dehydratase